MPVSRTIKKPEKAVISLLYDAADAPAGGERPSGAPRHLPNEFRRSSRAILCDLKRLQPRPSDLCATASNGSRRTQGCGRLLVAGKPAIRLIGDDESCFCCATAIRQRAVTGNG